MFFCVTESQLNKLLDRTTKGVLAYAMDRTRANKQIRPDREHLTYEYIADLFPTEDEIHQVLQANRPKKAMKKLVKRYTKLLYNPDMEEPRAYSFNLAVMSLIATATQRNRKIICFVKPDNINEQDKDYYKVVQFFLNAILAEFYGDDAGKGIPVVLFDRFFPSWVMKLPSKKKLKKKGLKKKEIKKFYKEFDKKVKKTVKYFEKIGFEVPEKLQDVEMKDKKVAKSITKFASFCNLTQSGQNLYDMIDLTFDVEFRTGNILGMDVSSLRGKTRKLMGNVIAGKLCGHTEVMIDKLEDNVSKGKESKKIIKKMRKRTKKIEKKDREYYKELKVMLEDKTTGLNAFVPQDAKMIKLPKVKKSKSSKKYEKTARKFAKLDPAILSAVFAHITARSLGTNIGDSEYNRVMSRMIGFSHRHGDPKVLAKNFTSIAKSIKKSNEAAKENAAK